MKIYEDKIQYWLPFSSSGGGKHFYVDVPEDFPYLKLNNSTINIAQRTNYPNSTNYKKPMMTNAD